MSRDSAAPRRPGQDRAATVTAFGGLAVHWDPRVLEPREWTAEQSWWAADLLGGAPGGAVLELFAGAGHIGQLAVRDSERHVVCVDLSPVACDYARRNAETNGLAGRVEVRCAAIGEAVAPGESYAMVIADPPWVPTVRVGEFPEDPRLAIDGGADGLDLARESLDVAARCLVPGGSLLLQLGTVDQVDALRDAALARDLHVGEVRTFARGTLVRLVLGRPAR